MPGVRLQRVARPRAFEVCGFCRCLSDPAAAGHAVINPRFPDTILRVRESIKVGSTLRINAGRGERGLLWQPRFFDRALRSVKEYYEEVECIQLNPVRAGPV